jgi:uridine kinase
MKLNVKIQIDGGQGAGKSELARGLASTLVKQGFTVRVDDDEESFSAAPATYAISSKVMKTATIKVIQVT